MANKRPLVLDDVGSGAGALREAGDGECANLINSPYCTYGGTANVITLTVNDSLGKPSAYVAGAQYRFRATAVNTGATTINIEGLGAKALVTVTGVALPAGYIRAGVDTTITYDAVGDRFVASREVERGNNSNGSFTRYEDGTILAFRRDNTLTTVSVTTPFNGLYYAEISISFPAAFFGDPSVSNVSESSGAIGIMEIGSVSAFGAGLRVLSAISAPSLNVYLAYSAVGRWY
ncbi:MAG: hypothetical protein CMK72_00960 [Pseudomonadaceae bacterium]|nr:hypothetical protein [Pseudomonadaceae bacterium]HCP54607.1 hypothetical protein [Pseudomonas sp.]